MLCRTLSQPNTTQHNGINLKALVLSPKIDAAEIKDFYSLNALVLGYGYRLTQLIPVCIIVHQSNRSIALQLNPHSQLSDALHRYFEIIDCVIGVVNQEAEDRSLPFGHRAVIAEADAFAADKEGSGFLIDFQTLIGA